MNLLNQAILISNWIEKFSTKKVNDCFDESQNKVPQEIQDYKQNIIRDFKQIQSMQLSPNNHQLNHFVKENSQ